MASELAMGVRAVLSELPIAVNFDPCWPGSVLVDAVVEPAEVARELYGVDASGVMEEVGSAPPGLRRYKLIQELLRPVYRERFAATMGNLVAADVNTVEDILFQTRIDGSDEATLIELVRRWANRRDLRDPAGRSYFDVFLGRLHDDQWFRDYGFWESSRTRYLDTLYSEVEERAGELQTLIARNSLEWGAYRPIWAALDVEGRPKPGGVTFEINRSLVTRASKMVRDGLEGWTSSADSKIIADVLTGLPAPELAAVLQDVMSHYDDRTLIGLGRYGEAWEGGMLYYLFEDLHAEDRDRVADAIRSAGVLPSGTVDALVAGRGWGGKYLPWTTRKGQEAAEFWANIAVHSDSKMATVASSVMGGFASLWTPQTAGTTALVLISAGAGTPAMAALSQASPLAGQALLLAGTLTTSFNVTIAVQNVVTNTDVWTGRPLEPGERLSQGLIAGSGVLLLGASFASAAAAGPAPVGSPKAITPPTGQLKLVYSAPPTAASSPATQTRFLTVPSSGGAAHALRPVQIPEIEKVPTPAPLRLVPAPAPVAAAPPAPSIPPAAPVVAGAVGTAAAAATQSKKAPAGQPRVPSGKTETDPRDHIPIVWLKPHFLYPDPIRLIDSTGVARDFDMTKPDQQVEPGHDIGIASGFLPSIGKSVQLQWVRNTDDRGPAVDRFRTLLNRHGWIDGSTHQIDHVQDLMWSGEDAPHNLWPLNAEINEGAGRGFMNLRVTYSNVPGGGPPTPTTTNVRIGTGMDAPPPDNLVGRWFVIDGYQLP